jgi:hypothetical protein
MLASCRADDGVDATERARRTPVPPSNRGVVLVQLTAASPTAEFSRSLELCGLATGLYELGLNDLPHLVAGEERAGASPGLGRPIRTRAEQWTARLGLGPQDGALALEGVLCDPTGLCRTQTETAPREELHAAVARLLVWTAGELRVELLPEVQAAWLLPPSKDPYAVLVAGRAAATLYGTWPAAEGLALGDRRRDPIDRAVYIDPKQGLSAWVLARRDALRGEVARARAGLSQALEARPWSALLQADDAALADLQGRPEAALDAWAEVVRRAPGDLRYTLPHAAAASRAAWGRV